jgi:putrescine transport system substrate-binding protein
MLRLMTAAGALAGILGGCSGGSSQTPGAAAGAAGNPRFDSEKVLNVFNWTEYIDPGVVRDFEREYGIKVNYDVYDSNEILETRLLVGHTNYDVVVPSAYFVETQIKAGIYQKLDKTRLPNLNNLDPEVVRDLAAYDPGNQYTVAYMWLSTTGIAYDVTKVRARLPGVPVDSWRLIYDPDLIAKLADCGVAMLDAPINIVASALVYLGKDPNSQSPADLAAAERALLAIRPFVRYVDSIRLSTDLANGEICVAVDWSGDIPLVRESARSAGNGVILDFAIPREGSVSNFDVLAIPADAPHPRNAHLFINYLLRPEIAARNSEAVKYASGVSGARALLSATVRDDPAVYPSAEVRARLVPSRAKSHEFTRLLMRSWTRFKTHQ